MPKAKPRATGPVQPPHEPTVTLGDIAERLLPLVPGLTPEQGHKFMLEKLRNWSRSGVIVPVAQQHGGAGKHRQYAGYTALWVAVVYVATAIGLDIPSQLKLVGALAHYHLPGWLDAKRRGRKLPAATLYLWWADGVVLAHFKPPLANPELLLTIDCGRLWSKIWKEGD
jgi:hypothetical protein